MLRSDLWASAFVRRYNDLGHMCVVVRRGDSVAGQIFIDVDHLDGTHSLLVPAPASLLNENDADRRFVRQLSHVLATAVQERIDREARFDPDLWVIALDLRRGDPDVTIVTG
jgi:hypothetical protein